MKKTWGILMKILMMMNKWVILSWGLLLRILNMKKR